MRSHWLSVPVSNSDRQPLVSSGLHLLTAFSARSLLVVGLLGSTASSSFGQVVTTDLGTLPGGAWSHAYAMNEAGQVVGASDIGPTDAGRPFHAFLWSPRAGMIDLGTLGGPNSTARAINKEGQVVGDSDTADGVSHAFLWTAETGMVDLDRRPDRYSAAYVLNDGGIIAGQTTDDGRLFRWTAGEQMTDLGMLPGAAAMEPVGVSATGRIIGSAVRWDCSEDDCNLVAYRAFSWTMRQGLQDLGTLGGDVSEIDAVNDRGEAVGSSTIGAGTRHAFLWTPAGGMRDLGQEAETTGISAAGTVVGRIRQSFPSHAFVWTATRGILDIGALGHRDTFALAVNGDIVVGAAVGEQFLREAFAWTAGRGMVDLGPGRAIAVNADGVIAGTNGDDNFLTEHAVIWRIGARTEPPIADGYVRGGAFANQNYGASARLYAKKGVAPDNTRRTYVKFDITDIKANDRVVLRLTGRLSDASTQQITTTIYVSDSAWQENTITWNRRPALGAVLGTVTFTRTSAETREVEITKLVAAQKHASNPEVSLALRLIEHTSAAVVFDSRETAHPGVEIEVVQRR